MKDSLSDYALYSKRDEQESGLLHIEKIFAFFAIFAVHFFNAKNAKDDAVKCI
jgi:hypothetical protein